MQYYALALLGLALARPWIPCPHSSSEDLEHADVFLIPSLVPYVMLPKEFLTCDIKCQIEASHWYPFQGLSSELPVTSTYALPKVSLV